jgi:hypothetical protein
LAAAGREDGGAGLAGSEYMIGISMAYGYRLVKVSVRILIGYGRGWEARGWDVEKGVVVWFLLDLRLLRRLQGKARVGN